MTGLLTIDKTVIGRMGNGVMPGIVTGSALGIGGLSGMPGSSSPV